MALEDYSTNPDNNGVVAGTPYFPAGMYANALAPAERRVMADIKTWSLKVLLAAGGVLTGALTRLGNASTILDTAATPNERLLGYRSIPFTAQRTAAATLALTDVGQTMPTSTGGVTVPANAAVAFALGDVASILNNGSGSQTITGASGVTLVWWSGTTQNTGNRTLAANGLATVLKIATDTWLVYGVGVS